MDYFTVKEIWVIKLAAGEHPWRVTAPFFFATAAIQMLGVGLQILETMNGLSFAVLVMWEAARRTCVGYVHQV